MFRNKNKLGALQNFKLNVKEMYKKSPNLKENTDIFTKLPSIANPLKYGMEILQNLNFSLNPVIMII